MKTLRTASIAFLATLTASPLWALADNVSSDVSSGVDQSIAPVAAPAEASAGGLPQFDPHKWPGQIFWLAISFTLMYVIFSTLILPRIGGVLETRNAKIGGDIATAERMRAEASQAQDSYEKLMANARTESTKLMSDAVLQTKAEAERQLTALQDRGVSQAERLEAEIEIAKKAAKQDMNSQIAEIASAAAEKIVGIAPDLNRAKTVVQALKGTEAA